MLTQVKIMNVLERCDYDNSRSSRSNSYMYICIYYYRNNTSGKPISNNRRTRSQYPEFAFEFVLTHRSDLNRKKPVLNIAILTWDHRGNRMSDRTQFSMCLQCARWLRWVYAIKTSDLRIVYSRNCTFTTRNARRARFCTWFEYLARKFTCLHANRKVGPTHGHVAAMHGPL